ncbi:MAG: hypothetical protein H7Y33_02550 [Cytophagales bacterium]|nr:hypothetical protein [Rhizobacter sp.]
MLEKSEWISRFATRLMELQPRAPHGSLPQVAETFWYYTRHRRPEDAAEARAAGTLPVLTRRRAWIAACSEAIKCLDPLLDDQDTTSLAERLWEADWVGAVDPYVMADALWDQAILLSHELNVSGNAPVDPHTVFRSRWEGNHRL